MSAQMDDMEAQNEALEELENTRDEHSLEEKFRRLEGGDSDGDKLLEEFKQRMSIEDARPDSLDELKRRMEEEEKEDDKPKDR